MSQFREMMSHEKVAHEDAPEPTTATTSPQRPCQSRKRKRLGLKRCKRGLNQFPDDTYAITDVSPNGQLQAPEEALPKYRNAIGFCGGINPYTLTARLGPGGLAHHETV